MKKIQFRLRHLLSLFVLLVLFVLAAKPAFAAPESTLTEERKAEITESVQSFLGEIFSYDDEILQQIGTQGDFYKVMVDAINAERDSLGAYIGLGETTVREVGEQALATTDVRFEKHSAEVELYFDYSREAQGYQPVNFVINVDYPLDVRIGQAAQNTVTGILVVFVVLFFLAFVIALFRFIAPKEKAPEPAVEEKSQKAAEDEAAVIAAVIAAAIRAAEEDAPSDSGYVVRSVRRSHR